MTHNRGMIDRRNTWTAPTPEPVDGPMIGEERPGDLVADDIDGIARRLDHRVVRDEEAAPVAPAL